MTDEERKLAVDAAAKLGIPSAVLESLFISIDRVCSSCMASTSQETWDILHANRPCKLYSPEGR